MPDFIQRFEIVAELGRGGMGVVYRARDTRLERDVAIKVLTAGGEAATRLEHATRETVDLRGGERDRAPSVAGDDLLAEAKMMARLSHPNVLPIYEVGVDGGSVFLVMEYIAGRTLRQWLASAPAPTTRGVIGMLAQAAHGLAAAHGRQIVHRDFKPENVLIGEDGRARVADFGLSGLVAPTRASMVRVEDARGTPRYMAPELWAGETATVRSDVYALAQTIADALDGRPDAPPRLVALAKRGLADDPAARPALAAYVAALEAQPNARKRALPFVALGFAVVAVGAIGGLLALRGVPAGRDSTRSCEGLSDVFAGRWDDPRRAALRARLPDDAGVIGTLDARAVEIANLRRDVCNARGRGEIGEAQEVARMSCLERRAIEIGADVRRALAHPEWKKADVAEVATQAATASNCMEIEAPPLGPDAAALWQRLVDSDDLPAAKQLAEMTALAADADKAGEAELAARATIAKAGWQRLADKLADADATLADAHRRATAIRSVPLTAIALVERSKIASAMGDTARADGYAKLAQDLADDPKLHARTRVRVYVALTHVDMERADYAGAVALADKGLAIVKAGDVRGGDLEASLRYDRVNAMARIDGKLAAAREEAKANVEWAHARLGEDNADYGVALDLYAIVLSLGGDYQDALPYRKKALDVLVRTLGPDSSYTLTQRDDLAIDLMSDGQLAEAQTEMEAVLAASENNEALKKLHATVLRNLGEARYRSGKTAEGEKMLVAAADEMAAQAGRDHPDALEARGQLVRVEVDLGHWDAAARDLAALVDARARRKDPAKYAAVLRGVDGARIAIARGDAAGAEKAATEALAVLAEAPELERAEVQLALVDAYLAQGKIAEAKAALDKAGARHARADDSAEVAVRRAEVAAMSGDRTGAAALAESALPALQKYGGHEWAVATARELAKK